MNEQLDQLLCLLDGKITAYRMKDTTDSMATTTIQLLTIQHKIQKMWEENIK